MAAGWNPTVVDAILDSVFSDASWTPPAASYVQLHTGDPGPNGTNNISSYSTRTALTWASASGGSKALSASVEISASWSGTDGEVVTHVSYWSASGGGTFIVSDQLTAPVTIAAGAEVDLPSATVPWSPLAA